MSNNLQPEQNEDDIPEEQYINEEAYEVIEDDEDIPMEDADYDEDYQAGQMGDGMQIVLEEAEGFEGEDEDVQGQEQSEDNSLGHSAHHKTSSSLFSISLHPNFPHPPLAVSGGEDDLAYIFSPLSSSSTSPEIQSFQPIALTGHTDSVIAASFSSSGEFVASGGMDGKVRIWRRVHKISADEAEQGITAWKDWEFLTSLDTGDEITWLTWHPKGAVLAAGCDDSTVWMWQIPSGNTMGVFSSHTQTSTCGIFTPSGKNLITTSSDSTLCIWDPRSPTPLAKLAPTSTPQYGSFSSGGITALAVSPASNLLAIGGANGSIRIINLPNGNVVGVLAGHKEEESVEGLEFMDLLGLAGPGGDAGGTKGLVLVSCGTDGRAIVWDVTTGNPRAEVSHNDVITSLHPHPAPARHLFTTASADKTLRTWDARQGKLIAEHKGHAGVVNGLSIGRAPQGWGIPQGEEEKIGDVVVSAGDDGAALIWRV